ncbi:MAG: DUF1501 domain-containing protein [Opitutae bacterium]
MSTLQNQGNTPVSRREILQATSAGFGYMAFAAMQAQAASTYGNPLTPKKPPMTAKAKQVIFACMRGGPSHVDTIDYKPTLAKNDGKTVAKFKGRKLLKSPWKFSRQGESGLPISELLPNLSKHADRLCLLNGMYADVPSHPQCFTQLHTGSFQFVRPSMGAWILYGLGTENQDLPGFITINPPTRVGGAQNYGSSFLPAVYQGTPVGQLGSDLKKATIGNLKNSRLGNAEQRRQLDLLQAMNRDLKAQQPTNQQIDGVIESYELAFRMQGAVPEVMDLSDEPAHIKKLYGIDSKSTDNFARQCLMARRFAESGVRFIEITHSSWDQHNGLRGRLATNCNAIDQPMAALLHDLGQRGMLEDTLVIWGGEFGRTPHVKRPDGRDHNSTGFSFWMAGGGVKGGMRHGATDENGIAAVQHRMHFHDLHATILHLLGLNHQDLTYEYAGRDFRLTDVFGNVAHEIIA